MDADPPGGFVRIRRSKLYVLAQFFALSRMVVESGPGEVTIARSDCPSNGPPDPVNVFRTSMYGLCDSSIESPPNRD